MKKILCLILALCVILPAGVSAAEEQKTDSETFKFLCAVGLMTAAEADSVKDVKEVNRGMFAEYAMRLYNTALPETDGGEFWDVDSQNPYCKSIYAAFHRGAVSGYTDGGFHPNDPISSEEALAVTVNILGYRQYAVSNGGYPFGYYRTAAELGIKKTFDTAGNVTGSQMAEMLKNALNVPVMQTVGINGRYTLDNTSSQTVLNRYFGISYAKGIVQRDSISGLRDKNGLPGNEIEIDGEIFVNEYDKINRYLGYNAECYYKNDESEAKTVVYIKKYDNDVLSISMDDFERTERLKLCYSNDRGKIEKIDFGYETAYIFNGKPIDFEKEYNDTLFSGEGTITAIDNNSDGVYDVLFADKYENLTVRSVDLSEGIIYGTDNDKLKFSGSTLDFKCILTDRNGTVNPKNLTAWDIISYTKSADEKFIRAYVSYEKSAGTVESFYKDGKKKYTLTVGGAEYKLSESCYRDPSVDYYMGKTVTVRLDIFGKIACITVGASQSGDKFGLVITAATENKIDDSKGGLKILDTPNKEPFVLNLADRVTMDGKRSLKPAEVIKRINSAAISPNLTGLFIRYKTNEDNKIIFIDTPIMGENEEEDSLVRRWSRDDAAIAYKSGGYIGQRYFKNADTKFFGIPKKSDIDAGNTECSCYGSFTNDGVYSVDIYSLGKDTIFMCGAVIEKDDSLLNMKVDEEQQLYVVSGTRKTFDEDGEYTALELINGRNEISVKIDDNHKNLIASLGRGDVIRYQTDMSGNITDIHFVYDYDQSKPVNGCVSKYSEHNLTVCGALYDTCDGYLKLALMTTQQLAQNGGTVAEDQVYVLKPNGYTAKITKNDISFEKCDTNLLSTWKNSGEDAQTVIYIMQYGQYIDALILK